MATYRDGGPRPTDDLADIRVIAPQSGDAIILARPLTRDTHDVPLDPRNPRRGIATTGCRDDVACPQCANGIRVTWRAYFPAWGVSIKGNRYSAAGRRVVLPVTSSCFLALEEFARTEAGETWWPGLRVKFRRGHRGELFADRVCRVADSALPAEPFDVATVVLRAWRDPGARQLGQRRSEVPAILSLPGTHEGSEPVAGGTTAGAAAPKAPPDQSVGMEEAARRFDALAETERQRWFAAARQAAPAVTGPLLLRDIAVHLWLRQLAADAG